MGIGTLSVWNNARKAAEAPLFEPYIELFRGKKGIFRFSKGNSVYCVKI